MQDDLLAKDALTGQAVSGEHAAERQLIDLQRDIAGALIEKNEAVSGVFIWWCFVCFEGGSVVGFDTLDIKLCF